MLTNVENRPLHKTRLAMFSARFVQKAEPACARWQTRQRGVTPFLSPFLSLFLSLIRARVVDQKSEEQRNESSYFYYVARLGS